MYKNTRVWEITGLFSAFSVGCLISWMIVLALVWAFGMADSTAPDSWTLISFIGLIGFGLIAITLRLLQERMETVAFRVLDRNLPEMEKYFEKKFEKNMKEYFKKRWKKYGKQRPPNGRSQKTFKKIKTH